MYICIYFICMYIKYICVYMYVYILYTYKFFSVEVTIVFCT